MDWLTDEELAEQQEELARDCARRVKELTKEIKALEAAGLADEFDAAKRKKRLRALYRLDKKQALENAARLRAGLVDKPPVGSTGAWKGAVSMKNW